MFPIGLAAVNQGYQEGATNYWKTRALEDENRANDALGRAFAQMQGGIASGPPPMAMPAPPGMPQAPGGPPMGGGGVQGAPLLGPVINAIRGSGGGALP